MYSCRLYTFYSDFIAKYTLVVESFTEIKTSYRGFETNEIWYFVCLSDLEGQILSNGFECKCKYFSNFLMQMQILLFATNAIQAYINILNVISIMRI